jgi:PhnB protein
MPGRDQLSGQQPRPTAELENQTLACADRGQELENPRRAGLQRRISREQAVDTIWLLMDLHGFIALTRDRGWSAERFEAWFIDSVHKLRAGDEAAPETGSHLSAVEYIHSETKETMSEQTNQSAAGGEHTNAPAAEHNVTAVPEHLGTITPRLALRDAAAAIDFYIKAFDAREIGERHCGPDGTVIHAELQIGSSIVMVTEDDGYRALLCTYWSDVDAAWKRAVAAGAEIVHPLDDQFYGERGGRLRDPFDQEWMLSMRLEELTAAEIAARVPAHD